MVSSRYTYMNNTAHGWHVLPFAFDLINILIINASLTLLARSIGSWCHDITQLTGETAVVGADWQPINCGGIMILIVIIWEVKSSTDIVL